MSRLQVQLAHVAIAEGDWKAAECNVMTAKSPGMFGVAHTNAIKPRASYEHASSCRKRKSGRSERSPMSRRLAKDTYHDEVTILVHN
jgi:hypothetical protein